MYVDMPKEVKEVIARNPHYLDSLSQAYGIRKARSGWAANFIHLRLLQELGFEMLDKCIPGRAGILGDVQT